MSDPLLSSENTVPSSSPGRATFSDEPTFPSSPPSSPPGFPWEQPEKNTSKPLQHVANNAFSILGKRKPLTALTENARPLKKSRTTFSSTKPTAPANTLAQTQLSLGQPTQIKCPTCCMSYVPSSDEDRKLHTKYHKQNTEGYDMGKDFVSKARPYSVYPGADHTGWACAIDCHDKWGRKGKAQGVMAVVQREMGAVEIPEDEIWDLKKADPRLCFDPIWRTYLYVKGGKCVGFLLVQAIEEAFGVEEPVDELPSMAKTAAVKTGETASTALASLKARQQAATERNERLSKRPLQLSKHTHPAKLGIARIWTSPTHRGQNIATTLLDAAIEHWNDQVRLTKEGKERVRRESTLPPESRRIMDELAGPPRERIESKDEVAFSQLTEAGRRLATRWFGKGWGWGVYMD